MLPIPRRAISISFLTIGIGLFSVGPSNAEESEQLASIGLKVWDCDRRSAVDRLEDMGLDVDISPFYGVFFDLLLPDNWFLSSELLVAASEANGNNVFIADNISVGRFKMETDNNFMGKFILGRSFKYLDLGGGMLGSLSTTSGKLDDITVESLPYSANGEYEGRSFQLGPILYARTAYRLFSSPFAVYASSLGGLAYTRSELQFAIGEEVTNDDDSSWEWGLEFETGLAAGYRRFIASAGYRWHIDLDKESENDGQGFIARAGIRF